MNEELLKRLDVLAAKLGVTAQYLWAVLIKQARIEAILDTGLALLFGGCVVAFLFYLKWYFSERNDSCEDWPDMLAIFGGVAALVFLIVSVCSAYSATTEWLNPEYAALSKILEAIGK